MSKEIKADRFICAKCGCCACDVCWEAGKNRCRHCHHFARIKESEKPKPKYDHAFTVAFSVQSDNEGDKVTKEELLQALKARVKCFEDNPEDEEILEACGLPFDTYEIE